MKNKTKRNLAIVLAVVAVLAVIILPQKITATVSSEMSVAAAVSKKPQYVAHRGLSALHPQNTMPAFKAAAEAGFYGYEFDIHTTKDGQWVVIHNDTVDAMTDGKGNVEDFTFEELQELTIDSGNGIENYPELKIPTLEETLSICDEYDIVPVIEIKKCDVQYLPQFVEMLEKHDLIEKAVVISFGFDYLTELQKVNSEIELMYLAKKPDKKIVDMCVENGNMGIDFKFENYILCIGALNYAKEKGLRLGAWTVDDTISSDIMRAAGVELITTNRILP